MPTERTVLCIVLDIIAIMAIYPQFDPDHQIVESKIFSMTSLPHLSTAAYNATYSQL